MFLTIRFCSITINMLYSEHNFSQNKNKKDHLLNGLFCCHKNKNAPDFSEAFFIKLKKIILKN